jgi:hypothetical protein
VHIFLHGPPPATSFVEAPLLHSRKSLVAAVRHDECQLTLQAVYPKELEK